MNSAKRRAAAYIAGRLISGKQAGAVYDYAGTARYRIYGDVSPDYIQVFDEDRNGYIRGGLTQTGMALFDHPTLRNIRLTISGDDFYGYDDESASYFSGEVTKSSVSFFDYQYGKSFRYAIQ